MALSDDILTILFSYSAGYKLMRQSLLGVPTSGHSRRTRQIKNQTLYLTLARLKERGLAAKRDNSWTITAKGKTYLKEKSERFLPRHRQPGAPPRRERNMIVAFDIPEQYHWKRDWLRIELSLLGFSPIQKSVWLGPAPLPKDFIKNLNSMEILEYIKFFEARERDIV
ncbi:MAG: hypothetical protein V1696_02165 [Candidatus Jorgensenbacteria bacterium]